MRRREYQRQNNKQLEVEISALIVLALEATLVDGGAIFLEVYSYSQFASRMYKLSFTTPLPPQEVELTVTGKKVQIIR